MATVPRPLKTVSAITAAPGPKARSVTMRRSKSIGGNLRRDRRAAAKTAPPR